MALCEGDVEAVVAIGRESDLIAFDQAEFCDEFSGEADGESVTPSGDFHRLPFFGMDIPKSEGIVNTKAVNF